MDRMKNRISSFEIADTLYAPLVVVKNTDEKLDAKVIGFIPGIVEISVLAEDVEKCKTKLYFEATNTFKKMKEENSPFPFFPTEKEVYEDFDDVLDISIIEIKKI